MKSGLPTRPTRPPCGGGPDWPAGWRQIYGNPAGSTRTSNASWLTPWGRKGGVTVVGGIVGGGFFARFGIAVAGAKGATPISFLLAGAIALVTAYSCVLFGLSSFLEDEQTLEAIRDKMRSAATGGLGRFGPLR